jgi:hypothetical protein
MSGIMELIFSIVAFLVYVYLNAITLKLLLKVEAVPILSSSTRRRQNNVTAGTDGLVLMVVTRGGNRRSSDGG